MINDRQPAIAYFNLALSYFDAARILTETPIVPDAINRPRIPFDSPVRHLYAHGWELALKACLRRQGTTAKKIQKEYGHNLTKIWDNIDKNRFAKLKLVPGTRVFVERIDRFHPTKMYAYPISGYRADFSIGYIRSASERFNISRYDIVGLFS